MFQNGAWVYSLSILMCAIGAFILNIRQPQYSLLDHTVGGAKVKRARVIYAVTFMMVAYIVFWAAIRNGVADTAEYIRGYEYLNENRTFKSFFMSEKEKAPLFKVYQVILKRLGFNWQHFLASIAIISGIFIYHGISKYSENVALTYYLFITALFYYWLFNGIRQFVVAVVLFANLKLIVEKKFWKLLILVFILYFIHSSAWIIIPIYFIANMKNWSYGIYACVLATMAVVLIFPDQFTALLDDSFEQYNVAENFAKDDGVNILRFLVSMVTPTLAFVYKDKINEYNNRYVNVLVNLSLISAGIYAIGVVTSGVFIGRLPLYADIFGIILLPFILDRVLPSRMKRPIFVACLLLYGIYFYTQVRNAYYTTNVFESMDMGGAQL